MTDTLNVSLAVTGVEQHLPKHTLSCVQICVFVSVSVCMCVCLPPFNHSHHFYYNSHLLLSCQTFSTTSPNSFLFKRPYQYHYMSFSWVNIGHVGYINPTHFSQNGFNYEILCLFTFCPHSINISESTWKCVTTLVKKNTCVKILLHANIWARNAALAKNYFSRHNNSQLPVPLSPCHLSILTKEMQTFSVEGWITLYLATFTCPKVFLFQHEWKWMRLKNSVWDLLKYTHGHI